MQQAGSGLWVEGAGNRGGQRLNGPTRIDADGSTDSECKEEDGDLVPRRLGYLPDIFESRGRPGSTKTLYGRNDLAGYRQFIGI